MACRVPNTGQIVAAHVPSGHDKGMGMKPSDIPAYLCGDCHDLVDGRAGHLFEEQKMSLYLDAAWWSILWLLQDDWLQVVPR